MAGAVSPRYQVAAGPARVAEPPLPAQRKVFNYTQGENGPVATGHSMVDIPGSEYEGGSNPYGGGGGSMALRGLSSAAGGSQQPAGEKESDLMRLKAELEMNAMKQRGQLNQSALNAQLATVQGMMGGGSQGGKQERMPIDPAKVQETRDLAFARAKDKHAETARASLDTLQGVLAGRGMIGSGLEGLATGQVVRGAADAQNDFILRQQTADLDYLNKEDEQEFVSNQNALNRKQQMQQSLLGLVNAAGNLY